MTNDAIELYWQALATLDGLPDKHALSADEARRLLDKASAEAAAQRDGELGEANKVGVAALQALTDGREILTRLELGDRIPRNVLPREVHGAIMAADFSSVVTKLRTAAETLEQHRSDARQRRRSEADQRERDLAEQRRREAALTKRRDQATAQQASWDAQHKRAVTMATVTAVVLLVAGLALGVLVSPVASVVMVIGAVSWWLVSKFAGPSGPRPVLPET